MRNICINLNTIYATEYWTKFCRGFKMTCKGICIRHKAQKPVGSGRYASGQKRCQICEIFIKWEGLWCPCCGYRLRTKPRNLKYKAKLRARKKIQESHIVKTISVRT
jgi:hypothetical protein